MERSEQQAGHSWFDSIERGIREVPATSQQHPFKYQLLNENTRGQQAAIFFMSWSKGSWMIPGAHSILETMHTNHYLHASYYHQPSQKHSYRPILYTYVTWNIWMRKSCLSRRLNRQNGYSTTEIHCALNPRPKSLSQKK
jgi:hypothetical protein